MKIICQTKINKKSNTYYFKLVGILIVPLVIITLYSSWDKELSIGNFVFQKAYFGNFFAKKDLVLADTLLLDSTNIEKNNVIYDTTSQRILLFGDSMVEGLSSRMRNYAKENGHELLNVIWYSSSTKIWSESDTLDYFINQFKPTFLMLCLGGNELFVRDLDKRNLYIQTLISKFDDKPYIWVGPPNWKEDTGINSLIEKNVGSDHYYPSKNLTFERRNDGAHPTTASAAKWMDSLAVWMNNKAAYRIKMEFPQSEGQSGKTILLRPLK